ncbi:activated RNA polymerase II transcriptional coactivator p15-like [Acanthaster planci]|uniref:Activated RNA polymerase II transcriptional coactivator p15 n=1 Tax=Acanthaster planci TaxID=133434 RepID=A0A8B7Z231_ACAPL|nr:activated RNA polymerase II transcriptional coactivator p15-like [Acanthaster planci]
MPRYKSKETLSSSDSGSDEEYQPKKKKMKEKHVEEPKEKSPKKKKKMGDGPEDHMYPLSRQRFVSVREFRGKVLIDIREYYTDNSGELKPGKKGISLTVEQWEKLKDSVDEVSNSVRELS